MKYIASILVGLAAVIAAAALGAWMLGGSSDEFDGDNDRGQW